MNPDDYAEPGGGKTLRRALRSVARCVNAAPVILVLLALVLISTPCRANAAEPGLTNLPPAEALLEAVRNRMPRDPLAIRGDFTISRTQQRKKQRLNMEILLDWGSQPLSAVYTILDPFGLELEELSIARLGHDTYLNYSRGSPLNAAPVPDLGTMIQNSDVTWRDLSLGYLWWPGGETVGTDAVKGHHCYVIDLANPAGDGGNYARVRLWISQKALMLLKAEGFSQNGELRKRLAMKSFKKVGTQWIAKQIDITSHPAGSRTRFAVRRIIIAEDRSRGQNDPFAPAE